MRTAIEYKFKPNTWQERINIYDLELIFLVPCHEDIIVCTSLVYNREVTVCIYFWSEGCVVYGMDDHFGILRCIVQLQI